MGPHRGYATGISTITEIKLLCSDVPKKSVHPAFGGIRFFVPGHKENVFPGLEAVNVPFWVALWSGGIPWRPEMSIKDLKRHSPVLPVNFTKMPASFKFLKLFQSPPRDGSPSHAERDVRAVFSAFFFSSPFLKCEQVNLIEDMLTMKPRSVSMTNCVHHKKQNNKGNPVRIPFFSCFCFILRSDQRE